MPHHSINWNIDSARKLKLQLDIVSIESVEESARRACTRWMLVNERLTQTDKGNEHVNAVSFDVFELHNISMDIHFQSIVKCLSQVQIYERIFTGFAAAAAATAVVVAVLSVLNEVKALARVSISADRAKRPPAKCLCKFYCEMRLRA